MYSSYWSSLVIGLVEKYLNVIRCAEIVSHLGNVRTLCERGMFAKEYKKIKALFIWRKVVPGKRVTLPAESTLASVYMRKKLTLLPEPRADRLEIMKTCEKKTASKSANQIGCFS